MIDSYKTRIGQFTEESDWIRRRGNIYSVLRLFMFLATIGFLILLDRINPVIAIASAVLAFAALLVFVSLSAGLSRRKILLKQLISINRNEISCLEGTFTQFKPGDTYQDDDHNYTSDLDIFGKHSLYQYLNRTGLYKGGEELARWLMQGTGKDEIQARQQAADELSGKIHWRQLYLANGVLADDSREDIESISRWITSPPYLLTRRGYRILLLLLPAITLVSIIMAFFYIPYNIPIFFLLLQLGIVGLNLRKSNHVHNQVTRRSNLLARYSELLESVEIESFVSELMNSLKSELKKDNMPAHLVIRKFAQLVERMDWRINMVAGVLLNAILMWDLQCVLRLEKWKFRYQDELLVWFDVLARIDALNCFANYKYNNPSSVFPQVNEKGPLIQGTALSHPLIPVQERISNDLEIKDFGEFFLITGSNMSGKSTFLRTLGVNLVLAMAGGPVCAQSMVFRPLGMISSMRIRDSLSSRESTFYAELKRLRKILDTHRNGEKVLILLDEILKGTNSRDKHYGSEMLIRQLLEYGGAGLIATHDLELSKLAAEYPGRLKNYCFEVQIENQEFLFDYKLREGVCSTLNATELMKKMGIKI